MSPVLLGGFLKAQLVKTPPATQETWVQSLMWEDLLEKGKALSLPVPCSPWGYKELTTEQLSLLLSLPLAPPEKPGNNGVGPYRYFYFAP